MNICTDQIYLPTYSKYSIPHIEVDDYMLDIKVVNIIKKQVALEHCSIPIDLMGNILTVAIANPTIETINLLEKLTGKKIRVFKSEQSRIVFNINQLY